MTTTQITWTRFKNAFANQAETFTSEVSELFDHLASAGSFDSKSVCPWVKLATFGDIRTKSNSLRHNANVLTITGVEGDYDGGEIQPEAAIIELEKAGIRAIVYTSPSHTPDKPRWRVLAPLSGACEPHTRTAYLARVNGALDGVLAGESFTLSQSYYYGAVTGKEYKVLATYDDLTDGRCVDELDELDEIAIFKEGKAHANDLLTDGTDGDLPLIDFSGLLKPSGPVAPSLAGAVGRIDCSVNLFADRVAELGRKLKTGDGRRDLIKTYVSSRSNKGLLYPELLGLVENAIGEYFDLSDPVDQTDIIGLIKGFAGKDSGKVDQPMDFGALMALKPSVKASKAKARGVEYPAPFPGVMADIVDAANRCAYKPQPGLNMLAALVGMAACVSGEYSTRSGGRFNLYGVGSLESGGGKDNPRMIAETVASLGQSTILGKPGSGAGLEDNLAARQNQLVSIDEMAHILKSMNDDRAAPHIRDIGATLLKLYSAGRGAYNKRILAKSQHRKDEVAATWNPCVSLLGFATPEGLGDAFTDANFTDGLMARMLFVTGDPTVVVRRPKQGFDVPESVQRVLSGFRAPIPLAFAQGGLPTGSLVVEESDAMVEVLDQLLVDMEVSRDMSYSVSKSLYARSFEKVERIAGVLAVWDDPTAPVLKIDHIEWARKLVLASDAALLQFVGRNMHSNEVTKQAGRMREVIAKALAGGYATQREVERVALAGGNVARATLLRVSKLDKATFDRVLAHMQDLGELQAFDGAGKGMPIIVNIAIDD